VKCHLKLPIDIDIEVEHTLVTIIGLVCQGVFVHVGEAKP